MPSGLSAVLYATIPLSSVLFTRALRMETLTPFKVIGAVIAFAGVAVMFSGSFGGHVSPVGLLAIFIAATAASFGTVLFKRGPRQSPIAANAVGCALGAVMAAVVSVAAGEPRVLPLTAAAALPLLYLTIAGSLGAFVIMSWLVGHWPVTRTSYVTVIVPIIAVVLGSIVRGEPLTASGWAGTALVLAGVLIGMRRPVRRPRKARVSSRRKHSPTCRGRAHIFGRRSALSCVRAKPARAVCLHELEGGQCERIQYYATRPRAGGWQGRRSSV